MYNLIYIEYITYSYSSNIFQMSKSTFNFRVMATENGIMLFSEEEMELGDEGNSGRDKVGVPLKSQVQ